MSGIETALRGEFPEATEAEVKRFVRSCQDGKKDADVVKAQAEKNLEDYLDWRSCFGLDYKNNDAVGTSDADDWKFAVGKALEVNASMRRAKELEKKLAEEAAKQEEEKKAPVNYDMEFSDSQKSEGGDKQEEDSKEEENGKAKDEAENGANKKESWGWGWGGKAKDEAETGANKEETTEEMSDEEKKKELAQIIFQHNDKDGNPIKDKEGVRILHVLPGLINRRVAQADFYALALCFYLDRKCDRATEENMTVVIDVRAGEGWPNPMAIMMVKFARTIVKQLQAHYPERLHSLVIFPVPWAAMGIWSAIKSVFRSDMMNKTMLVAGPADRDASLPKEKLAGSIDESVLDLTEQFRLDHFKPIGTFATED
jgi:hypothetical protein